MSSNSSKNVGVYIDGFNLYHAISSLNKTWLKWTNLRRLAESFLSLDENLEEVNLFTTLCSWDAEKRKRHLNFVKANKHFGVIVHEGKFTKITKKCKKHDRWCAFHEEKYTDVALAVSVLQDSYRARFKRMILLTADSD